MLEVVVFAVRGLKVERLFGDEGGNVLVLLFFGGFCGFSGHDENDIRRIERRDGSTSGLERSDAPLVRTNRDDEVTQEQYFHSSYIDT